MREPITGRDLFVISILSTGFGVLLAWGLFYRWGSAPQAKPFDAPAWMQAIGSVIAIGVAIYVPWRQRQQAIADEARKDRNRTKVAADALYPAIEQFRKSLSTLFDFKDLSYVARQSIPEDGIGRPREFDQFRQDLYLLGDLGSRINKLIGQHDYVRNCSMALRQTKTLSKKFLDKMNKEFPALIAEATECKAHLASMGVNE